MNNNEYLSLEISVLFDIINKLKFNKIELSDEEKLSMSIQLFRDCLLRSGVINVGTIYILTRLFASVPFDDDKRIEFNGKILKITNENNTSYLNIYFGSEAFREMSITYKQSQEKEVNLNICQKPLELSAKITMKNNNDVETKMYLDDFGFEVWESSVMKPSFTKASYVNLYRKYSRLEDDLDNYWSRELYSCAISNVVTVYGKEVASDKKYEYLSENDLIVFPTLEENVKGNNDYDELFYKVLYSNSRNLKKYFLPIVDSFEKVRIDKIKKHCLSFNKEDKNGSK